MYEIVIFIIFATVRCVRISICKRANRAKELKRAQKPKNLRRMINANHLTLVKNYSISVPRMNVTVSALLFCSRWA